ncbi:MAG TPA: hypothetical protein VMR52_05480, partial [Dehalococcoidia bacterium]|nr:hypothetical protein [Dehalococcoidia bacterium]
MIANDGIDGNTAQAPTPSNGGGGGGAGGSVLIRGSTVNLGTGLVTALNGSGGAGSGSGHGGGNGGEGRIRAEYSVSFSGTTNPVASVSAGDQDGDGVPDDIDNCVSIFNPGQEKADGDQWGDACDECPNTATTWLVPAGDGDCDGFTDAVEVSIGTDPDTQCGFSTSGAPSENWPGDLFGSNNVNTTDVLQMKPVFGQS